MSQSPIGKIIPYNRRIYRPYAEDIWRRFCAKEFVFIDTTEGAYVKDYDEFTQVVWPEECVLGVCDVWVILFDRGTTIGCLN